MEREELTAEVISKHIDTIYVSTDAAVDMFQRLDDTPDGPRIEKGWIYATCFNHTCDVIERTWQQHEALPKKERKRREATIDIAGRQWTIKGKVKNPALNQAESWLLTDEYTGTRLNITPPEHIPSSRGDGPAIVAFFEGVDAMDVLSDHGLLLGLSQITGHNDDSRWQVRRLDLATNLRLNRHPVPTDFGHPDRLGDHLVTKAKERRPTADPDEGPTCTPTAERNALTGMTWGKPESGRKLTIYNKTEQIRKGFKTCDQIKNDVRIHKARAAGIIESAEEECYLRGGNPSPGATFKPKWRVEHRVERKWLYDKGIQTIEHLKGSLNSISRTLDETWRLCEPTDDTNRARWPLKQLWKAVTEATPAAEQLKRVERIHESPAIEIARAANKVKSALAGAEELGFATTEMKAALKQAKHIIELVDEEHGTGEPLIPPMRNTQTERLLRWWQGKIPDSITSLAANLLERITTEQRLFGNVFSWCRDTNGTRGPRTIRPGQLLCLG